MARYKTTIQLVSLPNVNDGIQIGDGLLASFKYKFVTTRSAINEITIGATILETITNFIDAFNIDHNSTGLYDLGATSTEFTYTGEYIYVPVGTGETTSPPVEATYSVDVLYTTDYYLWLRMYGPDGSTDAIYIGFDGSMVRVWPNEWANYVWVQVNAAHPLTAGTHTVDIGHGEELTRADKILITNDLAYQPADVCGNADSNYDNVVDITELMSYIGEWKNGNVGIVKLMDGIGEWKNGC